jgi:hypothetical protein
MGGRGGRGERTVRRGEEGGNFGLHTLLVVVEVDVVAWVVSGGGTCTGGGRTECGKEEGRVGCKQGRVRGELVRQWLVLVIELCITCACTKPTRNVLKRKRRSIRLAEAR